MEYTADKYGVFIRLDELHTHTRKQGIDRGFSPRLAPWLFLKVSNRFHNDIQKNIYKKAKTSAYYWWQQVPNDIKKKIKYPALKNRMIELFNMCE